MQFGGCLIGKQVPISPIDDQDAIACRMVPVQSLVAESRLNPQRVEPCCGVR